MPGSYFTNMVDFKNIYNQSDFLNNNPRQACLSIITTPREVFELREEWMFSKQVMFEDTDNVEHPRALSSEMAEDIVKFLMEVNDTDYEDLTVHCFAGVSRSRAVVLFYEEVLRGNVVEDINRTPFITHNRFVYSCLVKAYRKIIDEQSINFDR